MKPSQTIQFDPLDVGNYSESYHRKSESEFHDSDSMIQIVTLLGDLYNILATKVLNIMFRTSSQIDLFLSGQSSIPIELLDKLKYDFFYEDKKRINELRDTIVERDLRVISEDIESIAENYLQKTGIDPHIELPHLPAFEYEEMVQLTNTIEQSIQKQRESCQEMIEQLIYLRETIVGNKETYEQISEQLSNVCTYGNYECQYCPICLSDTANLMDSVIEHLSTDLEYLDDVVNSLK